MNCSEITQIMTDIVAKSGELAKLDVPDQMLAKQAEIDDLIELLEPIYASDYKFIEALSDELAMDRLAEIYGEAFHDGEFDFGLFYLDIEDELDRVLGSKIGKNIDVRRYERFVANLTSGDFYNLIIKESERYSPGGRKLDESFAYRLLWALNAYLLNRYVPKGDEIDIRDTELPKALFHYFGAFLDGISVKAKFLGDYTGYQMRSGVLEAEEVGESAGNSMEGGLFMIKKAGHALGEQMTGGKIECQVTGNFVGSWMEGGEIIVRSAGDYLGKHMIGGKIIVDKCGSFAGQEMETGSILITKYAEMFVGSDMTGGSIYCKATKSDFGSGASGGQLVLETIPNANRATGAISESSVTILAMDEETDFDSTSSAESFVWGDHGPVRAAEGNIRGIASDLWASSWQELGSFFDGESGLKVVHGNANWLPQSWLVGQGFEGGIMVYKGTPKKGISSDGGTLIIDAPEADPKEVAKLIVPDRKVGDGLILMRIADGQGGYKLIDLEEA